VAMLAIAAAQRARNRWLMLVAGLLFALLAVLVLRPV